MKKYLFTILICMPLMASAQNVWEKPQVEKKQKIEQVKVTEKEANPDAKYLAGAVPEVNGEVVWTMSLNVPGKDAETLYQEMLQYMTDMTKEENQSEQSMVSLVNKSEHIIVAHFNEWLVFQDTFLSLDRTHFVYTIVTTCSDNKVDVKLFRISYIYEESRGSKNVYKAEDWITDKYALNKKGTKLAKITGKFRRKTIDRKDYIFNSISGLLNTNAIKQ